jgi:hypothetical protein
MEVSGINISGSIIDEITGWRRTIRHLQHTIIEYDFLPEPTA